MASGKISAVVGSGLLLASLGGSFSEAVFLGRSRLHQSGFLIFLAMDFSLATIGHQN